MCVVCVCVVCVSIVCVCVFVCVYTVGENALRSIEVSLCNGLPLVTVSSSQLFPCMCFVCMYVVSVCM